MCRRLILLAVLSCVGSIVRSLEEDDRNYIPDYYDGLVENPGGGDLFYTDDPQFARTTAPVSSPTTTDGATTGLTAEAEGVTIDGSGDGDGSDHGTGEASTHFVPHIIPLDGDGSGHGSGEESIHLGPHTSSPDNDVETAPANPPLPETRARICIVWRKDYDWNGSLAVYYTANLGPMVGVFVDALAGLSRDTRSVVFNVPKPGYYTVFVAAEVPGGGRVTLFHKQAVAVLASEHLPTFGTSTNAVETAPATTPLPGAGARVHFAWKKDYSWSGSLAVYYKASYGPEVGVLVEALAGLSPDTRSVVFSVPRPGFYTVYVAAEIPGRGFATLLRRHVLASRALPAPDTSPNTVETAPATTLLPGTGAHINISWLPVEPLKSISVYYTATSGLAAGQKVQVQMVLSPNATHVEFPVPRAGRYTVEIRGLGAALFDRRILFLGNVEAIVNDVTATMTPRGISPSTTDSNSDNEQVATTSSLATLLATPSSLTTNARSTDTTEDGTDGDGQDSENSLVDNHSFPVPSSSPPVEATETATATTASSPPTGGTISVSWTNDIHVVSFAVDYAALAGPNAGRRVQVYSALPSHTRHVEFTVPRTSIPYRVTVVGHLSEGFARVSIFSGLVYPTATMTTSGSGATTTGSNSDNAQETTAYSFVTMPAKSLPMATEPPTRRLVSAAFTTTPPVSESTVVTETKQQVNVVAEIAALKVKYDQLRQNIQALAKCNPRNLGYKYVPVDLSTGHKGTGEASVASLQFHKRRDQTLLKFAVATSIGPLSPGKHSALIEVLVDGARCQSPSPMQYAYSGSATTTAGSTLPVIVRGVCSRTDIGPLSKGIHTVTVRMRQAAPVADLSIDSFPKSTMFTEVTEICPGADSI